MTFTPDESGTSDSSGSEFYHNYACNIRRSATLYTGHNPGTSKTAALAALNTSYNSRHSLGEAVARLGHTRDYSSATLGRIPRNTSLAAKADYTRC